MDDDGDLMSIVRSCARITKKDNSSTNLVQWMNHTSFSPSSPPPSVPPLCNLMTSNQENTTINADFFPEFSLGSTNFDIQGLELESVHNGTMVYDMTRNLDPVPQQQHLTAADFVAQIMAVRGKSRRMKNEGKKVMEVEVPVWRGHNNDHWSWRKYGQKTMKGSQYPRQYYRCSSSKECPAKKYVEKSVSDPMTYVIIYVEKHNHPIPTRRPSHHPNSSSSSSSMSTTSLQTPSIDNSLLIIDQNQEALINNIIN